MVIVEGQTEETFIKELLNPYFLDHNIWITPTVINTKIEKGGNNFKGGLTTFDHLERDARKLLKDRTQYVTTLVDYYGLPKDFPELGRLKKENWSSIEIAKNLEHHLGEAFKNHRFIPYLQLHEFEGLLFSEIAGFEMYINRKSEKQQLEKIVSEFSNPEEINDSPHTAPSKRLISIFPGYEKLFWGTQIASEIGIEKMLEKCPHFREWINKLIALPPLS